VGSLKGLLRHIYLSADAFVCNSHEIEEEALACHVPRERVHYLPNAVDVNRFRPAEPGERARVRAEAGWPADGLLCLYVGRLSVEKGVLDLLEAWRSLPHAGWVLVLVGPDMPGSSMDAGAAAREYVATHGLTDVIFHGQSEDVPRLLRAADLYVQPSHYEAFSNAVIEAMATGLPIVATRVSGMLDCLVDGESALLSAARCPADLARQMARAIGDPALRARLGPAARRTVVERFSRAAIFGRFADLFSDMHRDGKH
jgi:glycosyltransferase involved in cell wall biosynthesis